MPSNASSSEIEIASFFSEGRKYLSEALSPREAPMTSEFAPSAPPAENSGEESTSQGPNPPEPNTPSLDGPAVCTVTPISQEAQSGNSSSGGIEDSPQVSPQPSHFSPPNSSAGNFSSGRVKSSGGFLLLRNTNGNPMLLAVDDISNLIGTPEGNTCIYYKSQLDPDSVQESFTTILELLNG